MIRPWPLLRNLSLRARFKLAVFQNCKIHAADSQAAFAINIMGAIVGGCLEYAALLTGYGTLLIVVGVIYGLAFTLKPRALAMHA